MTNVLSPGGGADAAVGPFAQELGGVHRLVLPVGFCRKRMHLGLRGF
jgi:hypothetical protein